MFRKAIKMLFLTGAVLGGSGFLLFGTNLGSYLGTVAATVKEGVEEQIPVEFEIRRAEKLIVQIDPQIETCKRDLANAEVELEELQASVVTLEKIVTSEESRLRAGADLLGGNTAVTASFGGDTLTRRRVERELQRTLDSCRNNQAMLRTKRALIERQSEAVSVAKQRLATVRAEKESLTDQVRTLKTQKQQIEMMAASQKRFDLDDSALSQAREALVKVQKRLDIAQKMLENDMVFHTDDPMVVNEPTRDVLREVREHLAGTDTAVLVDPTGR